MATFTKATTREVVKTRFGKRMVIGTKSHVPEKIDDKSKLQQKLMTCWGKATKDPVNTRIIIETAVLDPKQTWVDNDGVRHLWEVYFMIDGSDGERRYEGEKWMISASDGSYGEYLLPEEVLPKVQEIMSKYPIGRIYTDRY